MKKTLLFLIFVLLGLIFFSIFVWQQQIFVFKAKADVSQATFSIDNSYVFVSPLKARASGQEKIRITVFILNNQGLGVLGKKASVGLNPALQIDIIQGVTDQYGKAIFDVSSTTTGEYFLNVQIEGQKLNQEAHLSFY